jgi:hypothetical protein
MSRKYAATCALASASAAACVIIFLSPVSIIVAPSETISRAANAQKATETRGSFALRAVVDSDAFKNLSASCDFPGLMAAAGTRQIWRLKSPWWVDIDPLAAHCDPTLVTRDAARGVLDGRHVVFAGDSLSRYQYLSLAYFLETGHWSKGGPFAAGTGWANGQASNVIELHWGGWDVFFKGTSERLGREICDCAHTDLYENRYYITPDARVRLTYIKAMFGDKGWLPVMGHQLDELGVDCMETAFQARRKGRPPPSWPCPQRGCNISQCTKKGNEWSGDVWNELLSRVSVMRPDIFVMNMGHWGFPRTGAVSEDTLAVVRLLRNVSALGLRAIWKSTTAPRDAEKCAFFANFSAALASFAGIELFEAGVLTSGLSGGSNGPGDVGSAAYFDPLHFNDSPYAVLNTALLLQLASSPVMPQDSFKVGSAAARKC